MIELLSKDACVQCTASKRTLDKLQADYITTDIEQEPEARELAKGLGYLQAPVVLIRDAAGTIIDHWSGFHPEKLSQYAAA